MPIYEYVCSDCQTKFEVMRPMSQLSKPVACEHCHSKKTRRAMSLFSASSGGKPVTGTASSGGGCGGCSGGSCSGCGGSH
jgi:putative FmdB family regulatory protein